MDLAGLFKLDANNIDHLRTILHPSPIARVYAPQLQSGMQFNEGNRPTILIGRPPSYYLIVAHMNQSVGDCMYQL